MPKNKGPQTHVFDRETFDGLVMEESIGFLKKSSSSLFVSLSLVPSPSSPPLMPILLLHRYRCRRRVESCSDSNSINGTMSSITKCFLFVELWHFVFEGSGSVPQCTILHDLELHNNVPILTTLRVPAAVVADLSLVVSCVHARSAHGTATSNANLLDSKTTT